MKKAVLLCIEKYKVWDLSFTSSGSLGDPGSVEDKVPTPVRRGTLLIFDTA